MTNKDELKRLIDALPEAETDNAHRLLVSLLRGASSSAWESVQRAHASLAEDDEPETDDEADAVAAAKTESLRHSAEDVERLLGL